MAFDERSQQKDSGGHCPPFLSVCKNGTGSRSRTGDATFACKNQSIKRTVKQIHKNRLMQINFDFNENDVPYLLEIAKRIGRKDLIDNLICGECNSSRVAACMFDIQAELAKYIKARSKKIRKRVLEEFNSKLPKKYKDALNWKQVFSNVMSSGFESNISASLVLGNEIDYVVDGIKLVISTNEPDYVDLSDSSGDFWDDIETGMNFYDNESLFYASSQINQRLFWYLLGYVADSIPDIENLKTSEIDKYLNDAIKDGAHDVEGLSEDEFRQNYRPVLVEIIETQSEKCKSNWFSNVLNDTIPVIAGDYICDGYAPCSIVAFSSEMSGLAETLINDMFNAGESSFSMAVDEKNWDSTVDAFLAFDAVIILLIEANVAKNKF